MDWLVRSSKMRCSRERRNSAAFRNEMLQGPCRWRNTGGIQRINASSIDT